MDEKTFYESDNIKVTNARFIVNNQTYALSSVNSIKVCEVDVTSSPTAPALLIAGGIVWMLFFLSKGGIVDYIQPIVLIVVGFCLVIRIKKKFEYRVILTTSSGENAALRSNNKQEITLVEKALNDAIVYRG
ncbi:DUF6232 family protein [Pseudomonas farris]